MGCENLSDSELLKKVDKITQDVRKGKGLKVSIVAFGVLLKELEKRGLKKWNCYGFWWF